MFSRLPCLEAAREAYQRLDLVPTLLKPHRNWDTIRDGWIAREGRGFMCSKKSQEIRSEFDRERFFQHCFLYQGKYVLIYTHPKFVWWTDDLFSELCQKAWWVSDVTHPTSKLFWSWKSAVVPPQLLSPRKCCHTLPASQLTLCPLKIGHPKIKEVRSIFQPYLFIHLTFKGGFYVSFRECKMCKGWWLTSISNPQRFWLTTNPAVELTMGPGAPMDPVWCCRKAKKYAAGSTWRDGERWVSFFSKQRKVEERSKKNCWLMSFGYNRVYETASTYSFGWPISYLSADFSSFLDL